MPKCPGSPEDECNLRCGEIDSFPHKCQPLRATSSDPGQGINPKDLIGAKKAPLSLMPQSALVQIAPVFALGARKYGAYNWREAGKAVQHMTYVEAAQRHLASYIDGETIDPESGASHLAHVAAGMMILLDAIACGNAVDNRPTPAPTAELLKLQTKD